MSEFYGAPLDAHIPDDLTVAEFMLEYQHPLRPAQGTIPCLIEDATGRAVSLEELRERTFTLAQSLRTKYNIALNGHSLDYPVALWASQYLGAIFTGANPSSTPPELVYQLKLTEATLIIAHSSTLETAAKAANLAGLPSERVIILDSDPGLDVISVAALISDEISQGSQSFVPKRLGPGEGKTTVAAICMSSGTTGPPKIQLTLLNRDVHEFWCPGDVVLAILPFFHVAGLIFNIHWMLFCTTTLVVIPKFEFVGMLDSIVRHGIQHLMMVPPIALALCKHPAVKKYDLSRIKFLGSGAAPMTSELQNQLSQVCPQAKVGQAYGQNLRTSSLYYSHIVEGVGMLLPGTQARLVKSDGSLAGYDEPGELVIKTPSMSAETFSDDGWLRTGDEAKISKNGEVWITDRLKELIKVRGFQVSPAELEGLILNHPDVSDTCVVGVPDERSGEVPRAFVVLTEAAQKRAKIDPEPIKASIKKLVADNKVKYKHLAGVEFLDLIPKNASGKILRRILKERVKEYQTRAKL
ncbi:hypothetical protein B0H16DRAFT_1624970 [Mycena metata]|uniref:Acetyl-CoA synthetase-like protein n=1 Tax=Mycena metata TaxID=1033252 RepID=A0AAD7H5G9_9AGAR|nr:hypothetical protein B0H16DRAFT_1624970 [Mycena metata]